MKLMQFKMNHRKRNLILLISCGIFFICMIFLFFVSYAFYEQIVSYDVMKGIVPDQDYDVKVSFLQILEDGTKEVIDDIPEGKNWSVDVVCDKDAVANWNYDSWKLELRVLKTRTKCQLIFSPYRSPLIDYGIDERIVTSGTGLYVVEHDDAVISSSLNEDQKSNLRKTEYRYGGVSPKNYVLFNNELWRIIGLVNTPEGQRFKLIRSEPIGKYSWDTSAGSINSGGGINEWSQAKIMKLLNPNYTGTGGSLYWNRGSGKCYSDIGNVTTACNFSSSGLLDATKEMIDTITWNLGSQGNITNDEYRPYQMYQYERGNTHGKNCNPNNANNCSDTVTRTTLWKGLVGLVYPSDYGYSTSGGSQVHRETCLDTSMIYWENSEYLECKDNSWILNQSSDGKMLTMMPNYRYAMSHIGIFPSGTIGRTDTCYANYVFPVVYLKSQFLIFNGDGTSSSPYTF